MYACGAYRYLYFVYCSCGLKEAGEKALKGLMCIGLKVVLGLGTWPAMSPLITITYMYNALGLRRTCLSVFPHLPVLIRPDG